MYNSLVQCIHDVKKWYTVGLIVQGKKTREGNITVEVFTVLYSVALHAQPCMPSHACFHYIAEKPAVTFGCPSLNKVNEGGNFTCVCKGIGGNPPANVTWFKDDVQIDAPGKEKQTLTFSNISRTASGKYRCVAQSHTLTDERSIEIIVYCK